MERQRELSARVSLEEFEAMPEETGYRLELSRARVVREPRPAARHGVITGRIFRLLLEQGEQPGHGRVLIHNGFLLSREPPTLREPDVAFSTNAQLPDAIPDGFWPFSPDLAVEVISPSNTVYDINEKVVQYLEAGSHLVWVVDPHTRSVTIYRSLQDATILRGGDELSGEQVIPGLRQSLRELFAEWRL
jgi:Uma2 family endonuclease